VQLALQEIRSKNDRRLRQDEESDDLEQIRCQKYDAAIETLVFDSKKPQMDDWCA